MNVPRFESLAEYGPCFNDAGYWRPYVEYVCRHHGFAAPGEVRAGLPGTFPTFVVDKRYVVKFFGDLFDGPRRYAVEHEVYSLLRQAPQFPAPELLATGHLAPGAAAWSWPYLVSTALPGASLGEVRASVSYADHEAIARWLGRQMRELYTLRLPKHGALAATWEPFLEFLRERRAQCTSHHRRWGALPRHLLEQIDAFLPQIEALVDRATAPCLLHGDLNQDHVLGRFAASHWRPSGIIDFGDAIVGDPLFDLVPLHIGLCHGDTHLLRAFLDASALDLPGRERFVLRAMSYTLLFEFNVLGQVCEENPAAREAASLDALASLLWDLDQPGLVLTQRREGATE